MQTVDYILAHGKEIMYLLVGVSVFILSMSFAQLCVNANKILRKINSVMNFLEAYTEKPKQIIMLIDTFLSKWF